MIYEPREDSFLLQKFVKKFVKRGDKVLDVGTGSGIQAITALEITGDVTAIDINPECIGKIREHHPWIKPLVSDLFENLAKEDKFDVITFNPPYLPEEPKEPKDSALVTTGGKQGHEIIQEFLKHAKKYLEPNGIILLIYSSLSGDIEEIANFLGYKFEVLGSESFDFEKIFAAKLTKKILISKEN
jgi:release factor glutamine methyltransferase